MEFEGVQPSNSLDVGGFVRIALLSSSRERKSIHLWPGSAPTDPETPKNSKTQKSDSKVTFGASAKVTQKLLKSNSKVTKKVEKVTF